MFLGVEFRARLKCVKPFFEAANKNYTDGGQQIRSQCFEDHGIISQANGSRNSIVKDIMFIIIRHPFIIH